MKKLLIKVKHHWYYYWGGLASKVANTKYGSVPGWPFKCYQRWMWKASEIDRKYKLGYWTYFDKPKDQ